MKRQAIVVGAGPAGATAAFYLARAGIDVLMLDKESWPRDKPCGDGLRAPIWNLYKDMGVWDEVLEYSTPSKGVLLGAPNQTTIKLYGDVSPLCGPRRLIDHIVAKAAEREGAEFVQNFEVTKLIIKRGFVKGVVGVYQGKLTKIESDVVVVADGSHSRLSHQLGLYNEDPDLVFYGARGYFEDIDEMTDLIEFFYNDMFYPTGYMWVFPMSKTKGNVGAFITEGALQRSGMRLEDLFSWWRDNTELGHKRLHKARLIGELKGWRLPACWGPRDNYANGALVAGDAGNMIEAAFGGGQDLAMLAGKDAAEVIVEALETGDVSAKALSVYKDKLIKSQKEIYDGFNIARKLMFSDPNDLCEFVRLFKDKAESGELDYAQAVKQWVGMKMKAMQSK